MNKFITILEFIRVKQWIKNFFVAIPFVLSLKFLDFNFYNYFELALAIACFCLISSSVYILNDIFDIEEDKNHPRKKHRALPSNKISIGLAAIIALIFAAISIFLTYHFFSLTSLLILLGYCLLSITYSLKMKHYALFDVISISSGFVLRVLFGVFCFATPISKWIILLTFTICLFLAFTKRRKDFMTDGYLRKSLHGYNLVMLDKFIVISSVLAIASYIMYINEMINVTDNYFFLLTDVFVIFGIFRYLQALHLDKVDVGDSGIIIYKDIIFLLNILFWGITLLLCLVFSTNFL